MAPARPQAPDRTPRIVRSWIAPSRRIAGAPCARSTTVDAMPWLVENQTLETFERYDVLSERELESRFEVFVEQYTTNVNIEAETAASIARTMLLPAAVRHLSEL